MSNLDYSKLWFTAISSFAGAGAAIITGVKAVQEIIKHHKGGGS